LNIRNNSAKREAKAKREETPAAACAGQVEEAAVLCRTMLPQRLLLRNCLVKLSRQLFLDAHSQRPFPQVADVIVILHASAGKIANHGIPPAIQANDQLGLRRGKQLDRLHLRRGEFSPLISGCYCDRITNLRLNLHNVRHEFSLLRGNVKTRMRGSFG